MRPVGIAGRQTGAVAVEFALILPILMLFLFGVIQYGYGLFQLQSFGAALDQTSRQVATGITDCASFDLFLSRSVDEKGISPSDVADARLEWLGPDGHVTTRPEPAGQVRISATYHLFDIGLPGIPFPDSVVRRSTSGVQSVLSSALTGCSVSTLGH